MMENMPWWCGLTPAEMEEESGRERAAAAYREEGIDQPTPTGNVGSTDEF